MYAGSGAVVWDDRGMLGSRRWGSSLSGLRRGTSLSDPAPQQRPCLRLPRLSAHLRHQRGLSTQRVQHLRTSRGRGRGGGVERELWKKRNPKRQKQPSSFQTQRISDNNECSCYFILTFFKLIIIIIILSMIIILIGSILPAHFATVFLSREENTKAKKKAKKK